MYPENPPGGNPDEQTPQTLPYQQDEPLFSEDDIGDFMDAPEDSELEEPDTQAVYLGGSKKQKEHTQQTEGPKKPLLTGKERSSLKDKAQLIGAATKGPVGIAEFAVKHPDKLELLAKENWNRLPKIGLLKVIDKGLKKIETPSLKERISPVLLLKGVAKQLAKKPEKNNPAPGLKNDEVNKQNRPPGEAASIPGLKPNPANTLPFLKSLRKQPKQKDDKSPSQGNKPQEAPDKKDVLKDHLKKRLLTSLVPVLAFAAKALNLLPRGMRKPVASLLISLMLIPWVMLMIVLFDGNGQSGNTPEALAAGRNNPSQFCQEMNTTLTTRKSGKAVSLELPSTQGEYSYEESVEDLHGKGQRLALEAYKDSIPGFNQNYWDYYVTARWPYAASNFDGVSSTSLFEGLPSPADYAGKKIIIYNPTTQKAVVGAILEWGPAPWTGTEKEGKEAQRGLWSGPGSKANSAGTAYRLDDPSGYGGRVSGGPPKMSQKLGISPQDENDAIVYGFAKDQTLEPGQEVSCTPIITQEPAPGPGPGQAGVAEKDGVRNESSLRNVGPLRLVSNVPGVKQATETSCNKGAAAMVVLHYKSSAEGVANDNGKYLVQDTGFCSSNTASAIANELKDLSIRFSTVRSSGMSAATIKKSIDNNDPVIVNLKPGYASSMNNNHYVVVVGYDNENFYINDPHVYSDGTLHIYTNKTRTGKITTQDSLIRNLADTFGYAAIIRQR